MGQLLQAWEFLSCVCQDRWQYADAGKMLSGPPKGYLLCELSLPKSSSEALGPCQSLRTLPGRFLFPAKGSMTKESRTWENPYLRFDEETMIERSSLTLLGRGEESRASSSVPRLLYFFFA